MKTYMIPVLVIIGLLSGYYFFTQDTPEPLSYKQRLEDHRLELAYFMRANPSSPFLKNPIGFTELKFYPVDETYKVTADFIPIDDINKIDLPTSDGKVRAYFRYGYLNFSLQGQKQRLLVYKSATPGDNELFLGFSDPSNGGETYGGGRYLDINHSGQQKVILDFNMAYNPYCAYNEEFSCPIPPRENKISIPVKAGEMAYIK